MKRREQDRSVIEGSSHSGGAAVSSGLETVVLTTRHEAELEIFIGSDEDAHD